MIDLIQECKTTEHENEFDFNYKSYHYYERCYKHRSVSTILQADIPHTHKVRLLEEKGYHD